MAAEPVTQDAVDRLLEAWRGEVEARAVYSILAARERNERRAQLIREIHAYEPAHTEDHGERDGDDHPYLWKGERQP